MRPLQYLTIPAALIGAGTVGYLYSDKIKGIFSVPEEAFVQAPPEGGGGTEVAEKQFTIELVKPSGSILEVDAPRRALPGETVDIVVKSKNTMDTTATYTVQLYDRDANHAIAEKTETADSGATFRDEFKPSMPDRRWNLEVRLIFEEYKAAGMPAERQVVDSQKLTVGQKGKGLEIPEWAKYLGIGAGVVGGSVLATEYFTR